MKRTRAEIVAANDVAVREAVAALVLEHGWDGLTFTGVAKGAGLTVGAVYGRAESPAELGIDLWESDLGPWFVAAASALQDAAVAGSGTQVLRELRRWHAERSAALAVELLIASLFDEDLAEVIAVDALRTLSSYCAPRAAGSPVEARRAAAGVLLMSFAFGRAIATRAGVVLPTLDSRDGQVLAGFFHVPAYRRRLPEARSLAWVRPMTGVDEGTRAVVRGTISVVGRVGYKRATIARIARAAGVPRGSVLSRYDDKAHLVADAARLGLVAPGEVWGQYTDLVAQHGPFVSRAVFLADFLRPEYRPLWAVNLELARMSRFVPALAEFCPGDSVLEQTHLGVMLTACLVPDLATLPYAAPFTAGITT